MSDEAVVRCEQVLRDLVQRRDKLSANAEEISAQRKRLGYEVFAAGDKAARKEFDRINAEASLLSGEIEGLEGAIVEAKSRLASAKDAEARAADEEKASALLDIADAFDSEVGKLGEACDTLAAACTALATLHTKAYGLAAQRPTRKQLDIQLGRIVSTTIMRAGLQQQIGSEFLAPGDRKTADALRQHVDAIRVDANLRLGIEPEPAPKPNPPATKPAAAATNLGKKPSHRSVPDGWIKEPGPEPRTEPRVPRDWLKANQSTPTPPADWAGEQPQEIA
jgi:hypothetical protein